MSNRVDRGSPGIRSHAASPRATWRSVLAGVVLLAVAAFPTVAAASGTVTPVCNGKAASIVGQPGETAIRGTQGPDVIVGLEVGVRIDGRGGDDTICAGAGDNIITAGAGNDWIDGGDGANTIDLGSGDNTAIAEPGNDTILGGTGNATVNAGDGDNLVSTGAGDDVIVTGNGNDRIDGAKGFDTCTPAGSTTSATARSSSRRHRPPRRPAGAARRRSTADGRPRQTSKPRPGSAGASSRQPGTFSRAVEL
jgi:Ca2+-binding RTX toxin-like protein